MQPLRTLLHPVERRFGARTLTPPPAVGAPQITPLIAARFDEFRELPIGHGGARNVEWLERNAVRPFFVVEYEAAVVRRAQHEVAAGDRGVARA